MKPDRVPMRQTVNRKKQYGKHRPGSVPITVWEDTEFNDLLKEDVKAQTHLPKWTRSDHLSFILREYFHLWEKPYKPHRPKK